MIQFYYNTLMNILRYMAGDREIKTWTFHKGWLRILGSDWINRDASASIIRVLWIYVYPVLYILWLLLSVSLTIKESIQMKQDTTLTFIVAWNCVIVAFTFSYAATKGVLIKYQGKDLLELMDMVDSLGPLTRDTRKERDRTLLVSCLYTFLIFCTPGLWTIYWAFIHHNLPYMIDVPWDQDSMMGYLLTFQLDFVAAIFCAALHSTYDTMFPVAVGSLCSHTLQLRIKLASLGTSGDSSNDKQLLRECYIQHVNIIRVLKKVNSCFRPIFLFQVTYSVIHACVIIYQVMQVSDVILAIMNTSPILSAAYIQLLLYCYYGQRLTTKFDDLKKSLYENEWYNSNLEVKKALKIMTIMADREVILDAYGISFAGHATFLSSLQDSISYYLILKTVTTEE